MRSLPTILFVVAACGGSPPPPAPTPVIANEAKPEPAPAEPAPVEPAPVVAEAAAPATVEPTAAQGGAFASLTGTGDVSSGLDDANVYGGLLGNETSAGGTGTLGTGLGTGTGKAKGGPRKASAVPKVAIGSPTAAAGLDKNIIRRYIRRNLNKVRYCYEKQLLQKPTLAGTITATFTIATDGRVSASAATGVDPDVAACVAQVIGAIEFPKPHGGDVNVTYPFAVAPTGG